MDNTAQNEQELDLLPPEITNILYNSDLDYFLINMMEKYSISSDQKMLVVMTTRALLKGEIQPAEFMKMIVTVTGLEQDKASLLAQDINRDIFNPVKETLKQLHGMREQSNKVDMANSSMQTPQMTEVIPLRPTASVPLGAKPTQATLNVSTPTLSQSTTVREPLQVKTPAQISTPVTPVLSSIAKEQPTVQKPIASNLESKLGGVFTIKKEVMYTQPGAPLPLTPVSKPAELPLVAKQAVTPTVSVTQTAKSPLIPPPTNLPT